MNDKLLRHWRDGDFELRVRDGGEVNGAGQALLQFEFCDGGNKVCAGDDYAVLPDDPGNDDDLLDLLELIVMNEDFPLGSRREDLEQAVEEMAEAETYDWAGHEQPGTLYERPADV